MLKLDNWGHWVVLLYIKWPIYQMIYNFWWVWWVWLSEIFFNKKIVKDKWNWLWILVVSYFWLHVEFVMKFSIEIFKLSYIKKIVKLTLQTSSLNCIFILHYCKKNAWNFNNENIGGSWNFNPHLRSCLCSKTWWTSMKVNCCFLMNLNPSYM